MKGHVSRIASVSALAITAVLVATAPAAAQSSSLFAAEQQRAAAAPAEPARTPLAPVEISRISASAADSSRGALSLADASWTYQTPSEARKIVQINDIVKVTVSIKSQMTSQGSIDRKKLGHGDFKLTSWIKFYGQNLGENGGSTGQPPYGVPEIRGDIDNQLQANGNLQTADKLSFVISCRIVDKRPNGNCILEGTGNVSNNEEHWEYSLSGEVRPEDIKPDNSIISDTIADLKIIKRETGNVPDSYRRGWGLEWLDKWMPF